MRVLLIITLLCCFGRLAADELSSGTVVRVIDGDTFVLKDQRHIRIWGIDAQEVKLPGGKEAKKALEKIILKKRVTLELKGMSYNRVVARVLLPDGRDVALLMLVCGQASYVPFYAPDMVSYRGNLISLF